MRVLLLWSNHFPQAPCLNANTLGIRFQHMHFGGTKTFSLWQYLGWKVEKNWGWDGHIGPIVTRVSRVSLGERTRFTLGVNETTWFRDRIQISCLSCSRPGSHRAFRIYFCVLRFTGVLYRALSKTPSLELLETDFSSVQPGELWLAHLRELSEGRHRLLLFESLVPYSTVPDVSKHSVNIGWMN